MENVGRIFEGEVGYGNVCRAAGNVEHCRAAVGAISSETVPEGLAITIDKTSTRERPNLGGVDTTHIESGSFALPVGEVVGNLESSFDLKIAVGTASEGDCTKNHVSLAGRDHDDATGAAGCDGRVNGGGIALRGDAIGGRCT